MIPTTVHVGAGAIVTCEGRTFCIKRFISLDEVLARDVVAGVDRKLRLSDITSSYGKAVDDEGTSRDLTSISEDDWDLAVERYKAMRPLIHNRDRTARLVGEVADELLVTVSTVYRWLERVERFGTVSCLLRKRRSDAGGKRLDQRVEEIIKEVILNEYLTDLKKSPTATLREIRRRCKNLSLPLPSKVALLSRISEILPEERARKREGRNAALALRAKKGSLPNVDTLYSKWQIDHTPVDLMLVDERDRIPIGRPWITLAMDVFSRMVVGWYISFDPPGSLSTGLCIASAILPKDLLLSQLNVDFPWPCQGKPGVIMADNAKEFHGTMLQDASQEHGFQMQFRKRRTPNYGGHIESRRLQELSATRSLN
ncbi:DDE-type integrase/transposase/recombinase (plasmid) [Pseudomonas sp. BYT-5]|uniref:DDE-type integrase/transposase/recombinase n=1 Tax=unclassified Pseudomonas TaxID=196821 RepID=UPI002021DD59|nr:MULTISPECIES: DDE-type integrase/transposase/recombinase [unclassified Pseudomonas]URD45470.1 DDE-type integrase/transposase/recombinase [Pseudomonas sp. BYT-5]URL00705.1 DDE-type integrase/transposase/recombinase [Pseudomonas sp. BYT-1]